MSARTRPITTTAGTSPFAFSEAALAECRAIIARYPQGRSKSALIPILHIAQAENDGWKRDCADRDRLPDPCRQPADAFTTTRRRSGDWHRCGIHTARWRRGARCDRDELAVRYIGARAALRLQRCRCRGGRERDRARSRRRCVCGNSAGQRAGILQSIRCASGKRWRYSRSDAAVNRRLG